MSEDLSKKKELSDAAKALIEDRAFSAAILSLRKRWFDELMVADKQEKMIELIAQMRALEAIPAELGTLINDFRMASHRQQRQPNAA